MAIAQFYPSPEDPKIFHRAHPTNPLLSATVSMHVDDGLGCCLHKPFKDELKRVLTERYGKMEWDDVATSSTGYNIKRFTGWLNYSRPARLSHASSNYIWSN